MRLFFLLLSISLVSVLYSQPLLFENYTSEQGLSQNSCYSIAQDAEGFMWFGTQDGLNRYDGKQFKVFWPQSEIGKNLPSNYISSLYFDHDKKLLWIGTIEGLCFYHMQRDSLVLLTGLFPFASVLAKTGIKKIASFKKNEFWITTFNKGLFLLNIEKGTIQSFFDDPVYQNQVTDIVVHKGQIIVSLLYHLFRLDHRGNEFLVSPLLSGHRFAEIKELYSFNGSLWVGTLTGGCFYITDNLESESSIHYIETGSAGIGCFATDARGNLWIGTRGKGIVQYNPVTNKIAQAAHNPYDKRSPGKNFILSLFKDRQGLMWCGLSGAGVSKYDPLKYQFQSISYNPVNTRSLPDNMVFDIFKARDGQYFVGTQNSGLTQWNRETNEFTSYPASSAYGTMINIIYDITEDERNNLWIASWGGLIQLERKTKRIRYHTNDMLLTSKKLYALIKLKNADSLFVASERGPVFYSLKDNRWYPCPDNVFQPNVSIGRFNLLTGRYIYEGENNTLWICTVGAALVRYEYRKQEIEIIEPVKEISIYARHLFHDGSLFWIATDNGIVVYDFKKKKIEKHILPNASAGSNVCYAIQKDKQGFFWASTNTGLYKIDPRTYTVEKNYNSGNGLDFLEYNTACAFTESDGSLMFGGVGGITVFNPAELNENTFSPVPLITGISVNDKPWAFQQNIGSAKELRFKHHENFITLQFAVNNFSNERNNLFSYRLKGLTDKWSAASSDNMARFTSLPAGKYQFELRSANSDGKWSREITRLSIIVLTPWWQAWWFLLASFLLLAGIVIYLVRKRIKAIKKDATLKQQFAELEIKGLHAQMNPHFIFNSLNSIKEMILAEEKQNASRYLSKFAQLIRTNLEQSRQAFITLQQCIDHLEQYLEMEKIRFEDFQYSIHIDAALVSEDILMAPMLIQPLVENAIWHGLRNKSGDKKLVIRFYKKAGKLVCEINDNGTGIIQSRKNKPALHAVHRSLGITNVHERLAVLNEKYGMNCSLSIVDKSELEGVKESGTLATLQLTILNQPA